MVMMSFKVQGDSLPGKALVTGCAALMLSALPTDTSSSTWYTCGNITTGMPSKRAWTAI